MSRPTSTASDIAAGLLMSPELTWRPKRAPRLQPRRTLRARLRRN